MPRTDHTSTPHLTMTTTTNITLTLTLTSISLDRSYEADMPAALESRLERCLGSVYRDAASIAPMLDRVCDEVGTHRYLIARAVGSDGSTWTIRTGPGTTVSSSPAQGPRGWAALESRPSVVRPVRVSAEQIAAYRASGVVGATEAADAAAYAMECSPVETMGYPTPRAVQQVALWCATRGL